MAARHRKPTKKRNQESRRRRDTDRVVRWLRAGAVATGVGAAVISGHGTAWATTDGDADTSTDTNTTAADTGATTESAGNPATNPAAGPATDTNSNTDGEDEDDT